MISTMKSETTAVQSLTPSASRRPSVAVSRTAELAPEDRAISHPAINPETWVDAYGDYLYRFALSRVHDPAAAEDLVQETFLAALKGLSSYKGDVDVKYWLRGILRNKSVDHIRRSVRERPVAELEALDEPVSRMRKWFGITQRKVDPWTFDPAEVYEDGEFWIVFNRCLADLKSPLREIYTLKEIDNISSEQICADFGITPNNLWVIIHRARKQLKASLMTAWVHDRSPRS